MSDEKSEEGKGNPDDFLLNFKFPSANVLMRRIRVASLRMENENRERMAARAAENREWEQRRYIFDLVDHLHAYKGENRKAMRTLVRLGKTALPTLFRELKPGRMHSESITKILAKIRDPSAIPHIIEAMQHAEMVYDAVACVNALGEFADPVAFEPLVHELSRAVHTELRVAVLEALAKLPNKEEAVPVILNFLVGERQFDKVANAAARNALVRIGEPAARYLLEDLKNLTPEEYNRRWRKTLTSRAIVKMGIEDAAITVLMERMVADSTERELCETFMAEINYERGKGRYAHRNARPVLGDLESGLDFRSAMKHMRRRQVAPAANAGKPLPNKALAGAIA